MALTTQIKLRATVTRGDAIDGGARDISFGIPVGYNWGHGTIADSADLAWRDNNTLAASANVDLDLAGTSLTDPAGATISFARVRAIILTAASSNSNNVVLGGAATNQFVGPFGAATHTIACPPGGTIALVHPGTTGWTVTPTTGDLLRVANSGAGSTVSYQILIIGASA